MKVPLATRGGCDKFLIFCLEVPELRIYWTLGAQGMVLLSFVGLCEWRCNIFFVNGFMSWVLSLFYLNETFTPHDVARSVMYVESTRGR